ncbi:MAG: 6-phosphogluconolactonase [Propionibacteriales bacterium]|nr:6-phosphogluconolactonase [Propionibacteriales bacterium]
MTDATVIVHHNADELAQSVAARIITSFVDAQSAGRVPHWVLTGGTIADQIHRAVAQSAARHALDWSRVEFWWGDERYVAADEESRNELQARRTLLDLLPVDQRRVHPMPAARENSDAEADAAAYADTLSRAASPEDHGPVPLFDVLMLGVGPDGHVASLFPERPALYDERSVVAVRGAPKPPPTRLTLTMRSLQRAREVWFVVAGEEKAQAVRLALSDAGVVQVPAAGPRGRARTLWMLDRAAASQLPPGLNRIASP